PQATAFDYMAEAKMGFRTRYHVVPFPPTPSQYKNAANTITLSVDAVAKALKKSNLSGNDIDAWFVGTATAPQRAPGIAEYVKSYFSSPSNQSPTYSSTSACVGFNANLEAALAYFNSHPNAQHIVVAHAEVMSQLLFEERDFVPFTTFGDSAAAVVLSRVKTAKKYGVVAIRNNEDIAMLDFLGADAGGNLFMEPRMVKSRAVPNITFTAEQLLKQCKWNIDDLALFVPHQTGNAIVHSVAKNLGVDMAKVYQDVQVNYGNLSGASIPACFDLLDEAGRLKPEDKILTAVAGLGGEFGGFAYIVPPKKSIFSPSLELQGKTMMLTGASGGIGRQIAVSAAKKGADLILLYNSNDVVINELRKNIETEYGTKVSVEKLNLSDASQVDAMVSSVSEKYGKVDYLVVTHAVTGSLSRATKVSNLEYQEVERINYESVSYLCRSMRDFVSESVLITGSVGEDAQFAGSAPYVMSKRSLRGFARNFANEIYLKGVKCVYYLPGLIDAGMLSKLDETQINASLAAVNQSELTRAEDIAERMVLSVCRLKVQNVRISFEEKLTVIKDVYLNY
ncbi:MAG: SDR family NAD(P)-dependent oxidoreductase, partial [Bacteroidales bacterium]|nr:SDR family NAD(P)-dependent oxidoreductase [Bacteroidales bacterium]